MNTNVKQTNKLHPKFAALRSKDLLRPVSSWTAWNCALGREFSAMRWKAGEPRGGILWSNTRCLMDFNGVYSAYKYVECDSIDASLVHLLGISNLKSVSAWDGWMYWAGLIPTCTLTCWSCLNMGCRGRTIVLQTYKASLGQRVGWNKRGLVLKHLHRSIQSNYAIGLYSLYMSIHVYTIYTVYTVYSVYTV